MAEERRNRRGEMAMAVLLLAMSMFAGSEAVDRVLYTELGLADNATAGEVSAAYRGHADAWTAEKKYEPAEILKMIEIQHAYEVLSNKLSRRDYDHFNFDVLQADMVAIRQQYRGRKQAEYVQFPLWKPRQLAESIPSTAETVTYHNFGDLVLYSSDLWLIQIYSVASPECHAFAPVWDRIVDLLEGVVRAGRLELGEMPLSIYLAERNWLRGYPFFRNGIPAIIAVRPGCRKMNCIVRYYDEKSSAAIADWAATRLLRLPRISYYTVQSLMADIIHKPGPHKVKVIQFSSTGERAPLYLRQASRDYREYAVFGMVLFRESDGTFWDSKIGVESAPATVFLKDPGLPPVIHHGKLTSAKFRRLMETHKTFELPQLRSITAANLGCDASNYSLAGEKTKIWYCVVGVGRPGLALNQLRGALRLVQDRLKSSAAEEPSSTPSVKAFKEKRLRLAWLDGELQKEFCYFYLNVENMFEACGPRKFDMEDIPKIFLIRYIRVEPEEGPQKKRWLPKTKWEKQAEGERTEYAAQLVTKYNGSAETSDIVEWMSSMVTQGDNEDLPSFRGQSPSLIAEEAIPYTAKTREFVASKTDSISEIGKRVFRVGLDFKEDPFFLPLVTFIVLFYMGACYLGAKHKKSLANQVAKDNAASEGVEAVNSTVTEDSSVGESSVEQMPSLQSEGLRRREIYQGSSVS